jgi:hypothetical protein
MKPKILVAIGLVVAIAGVAFLFLRDQSPEYANVRELVAALEVRDIECEQLNVSAPNPTPDIVDFGSCQMDGKTVNLHVYKSDDAVAEHVEGNVKARELGNPNYFTSLVTGSTWVIDTYSEDTARKIQQAIGGEIH